jgi:hypothetical protein
MQIIVPNLEYVRYPRHWQEIGEGETRMPNSLSHPWFFALFFPPFFIGVWVLTTYVLAMLSGWNLLSKRFRYIGGYYGKTWPFQSARMRTFVHFGNALTMGADESGLYMAVFPLFRFGNPPLLVPWSEVSILAGERGLIFKKRVLLLGRQEAISLSISCSLAEDLKEAAGQAWPVEPFA